jgi:FAD:protein FMN transferase
MTTNSTAARRPNAAPPARLVHAEAVMGTVVSFDVRAGDASDDGSTARVRAAIDDACEWLHAVDARFSPFRDDSEVNRMADGTLDEGDAHPDIRAILAMADALAIDSSGAFDVRHWRSDGRLDPSAIVKGWAIEAAASRIGSSGARDYAVNAGGDIVARGGPLPGVPWRIGIRHPDRPDRVAAVLTVSDRSVATSAAYERGSHIRDPRSGMTPSGVRSLTVVGPSLTWADAYATAGYVMGLDGPAWVARHDGYDAYAITWDDTVRWTSGMDRYLVR